MPANPSGIHSTQELESATIRKITWHIMPVLLVAYSFAYIDRVNVGFAALTANKELGLSDVEFGFGAGLFFLGYSGAQVPSNLMMLRYGARRWFARILISMGILAVAMMAVVGPRSFYAVRLALGIAEAGLLPGVIYYLRNWFPQAYRANSMAVFLLAIPLSSLLGSPISGALLGLDGAFGLHGWQWMYLLEGVPLIIFGLIVLSVIAETPAKAGWLTSAQRQWLEKTLADEAKARAAPQPEPSWWKLVIDPRVICYGTAFFGITAGSYGLSFWLPQIVKSFGLTNFMTGLVVAIPYLFGAVATIVWARHSDRRRERLYHTALPAFLAAAGLAACGAISSPVLTMVALTVAALGIFGIRGPYFALVAEDFAHTAAAPAIAWIDTFASLGGFFGPTIVGWLRQTTGSYAWSLLALAFLSLLGGVIILSRNLFRQRGGSLVPAQLTGSAE
jgi:ACS family tartrate transporter-like MFS transporter